MMLIAQKLRAWSSS